MEETQEIYIKIKMEYQKITKLLGSTLDKVPRFITLLLKNG